MKVWVRVELESKDIEKLLGRSETRPTEAVELQLKRLIRKQLKLEATDELEIIVD